MTFLIVFHAIICVMLAIIILMQAGRRGGLTEAFASTESMLGTKTNSFMVTATTIFCILFFVTSLGIAVLSAQKGKSLMTDANVRPKMKQTQETGQMPKESSAVEQDVPQAAADAQTAVQAAVDQSSQNVSSAAAAVDQAVTQAAQGVVDVADQAVEAVVPSASVPSAEQKSAVDGQ